MRMPAFTWRYSRNDITSIINHFPGVKTALITRDALHENWRLFIYENAHAILPAHAILIIA